MKAFVAMVNGVLDQLQGVTHLSKTVTVHLMSLVTGG
jgi:hypothetical protein